MRFRRDVWAKPQPIKESFNLNFPLHGSNEIRMGNLGVRLGYVR